MNSIREALHDGVNDNSQVQISRINEGLIQDALNLLKAKKKDAIFDISSDLFIHGPPQLVTHLTNLIRLCFSHGTVPYFILLCTLLPLVKDNLGDRTSSENYRAIAGGCLLLKLFDLVILLLEGDKLGFDELQFAYQAKSSTTMCTWLVTAVVDHFNRSGATVYGAAMDMSKAFDMVEWPELFRTLLERKVDPVFLRLILFIYENQYCNVKWCGKYSASFTVKNGVRQGGVSSGIFFAVYIDKILLLLRSSRLGCHINNIFLGAMVFADDIFLLSASRSAVQEMVNMCRTFAAEINLKFGTNPDPKKAKTKCIVFAKKMKAGQNLANIKLNGVDLPWVTQVKHLGHTLQSDNTMKVDMAIKRGAFIGKANCLLQEFHTVPYEFFLNTWNILSTDCERLYSSFEH